MHGHSYHLTITVRGPVLWDGFVIDFANVKAAAKPIIEQLDHHCVNEIIDNPTVENQLIWLWEQLELPGLYELTLRETSTNSARYRGTV
jgi:6-pyruvoyltetrahydropterin/6-carboxytetrahydropterin synthase